MNVIRNSQVCMESDIGLNREKNEDTDLIVDHNSKDVDISMFILILYFCKDIVRRLTYSIG
jgi:hypothetical protein